MLCVHRSPLLVKVPYASLFHFNSVLRSVFEASAERVALVEELPGMSPRRYTYGTLQQDVIAMADLIVARKEALAEARGESTLSWMQLSKPAHVRSIFAEGSHTPSCDYMKDTGKYTCSIMCGPGYAFMVSLLALWSLNLLATPMSVSERYDSELTYVLEHSGTRQILGETALLAEKLPASYRSLYVCSSADIGKLSSTALLASTAARKDVGENTFLVDTVLDVRSIVADVSEQRQHCTEQSALSEVEFLQPEESKKPMDSAADVLHRLEEEKEDERDRFYARQCSLLQQQHRERNVAPEEYAAPLHFETDTLDELNAVHRRWYCHPELQPTVHDDCIMLYTSGTTARPKGAVHTHASVSNMVSVLQDAWRWTSEDCILHMLPMHHVHGLVNVVLCSIASHARCVATKFDSPVRIARRIAQGDISLVMAVPTIYTKLIAALNSQLSPIEQTAFRKTCMQRVRLMVSGSASLPVPTLTQFYALSGHILLERYGMTEVGMALSQRLLPVEERIPGTVGEPLPTVAAFVYHPNEASEADKARQPDATVEHGTFADVGSLAIASISLFDRYWNNPVATRKALCVDSRGKPYFDTGDTVGIQYPKGRCEPAVFTILGRTSMDIIKSRGYKLSALEIEAALLSCKDLFYEVAVVGVKDDVRGEMVVAVVALQPRALQARGIAFDETTKTYQSDELNKELKAVTAQIIAQYKCPSQFIVVQEIPRNATGKVNKVQLKCWLGLA